MMDIKPKIAEINPNWRVLQIHADNSEKHELSQAEHVLIDIYLLSLMDDVIVSPRSTIGYIVSALRGRASMYPSAFDGSRPDAHTVDSSLFPVTFTAQGCYRAISHEPCFHGYFEATLSGATGALADGRLVRCGDTAGQLDWKSVKKTKIGYQLVVN